ncbi:MAG: hypothetical protein OXN88_14680 [Chloroflexota bacterium]|nr:hypothetical protein [Chloroflexota bacterium]
MALRRSYTATVERNVIWKGEFASEPYESAWASEAIFFVRALDVSPDFSGGARVQISADGIHWADEGTVFDLPTAVDAVTFGRVTHFGGWLRLRGSLKDGTSITVLVSLALKE